MRNEAKSTCYVGQAVGEPLSLKHRGAIEALLERLRYGLSEYSFANLYLFKDIHQYRLISDPFPFLLGVTYDGESHAMPLLSLEDEHLETLFQHASCVYPIPKGEGQLVAAGNLDSSWNDDDSDYLFEAAKLSRLAGSRLRSKRAQSERFSRSIQPVVVELNEENTPRARQVLQTWARQLPPERTVNDCDACARALTEFKELGLEGILITDAAQKDYGFLIASRLHDGTLAVHFAKGDRDYDGVYPFMFSQFAARTVPGYLNFEQDLGASGLRRAKRALDPVSLLRKYRFRRRATARQAGS